MPFLSSLPVLSRQHGAGGHGARLLTNDDGKETSGPVPTIGVKMKEPRRGAEGREALGVQRQPGDEQRTVMCDCTSSEWGRPPHNSSVNSA